MGGSRPSEKSLVGTPREANAPSSASTASLTLGEPGSELRLRLARAITTNGLIDANHHLECIAREIERMRGVKAMPETR